MMKIKITRHIRKYIILYLALVLALYLVIEMVPRITDIFETTQILEPGELVLTDDATGYMIKSEAIAIAPGSGSIKYLVKDGTAVRKNQDVVGAAVNGEEGFSRRYDDVLRQLEGYSGLVETWKTPISGIFSLTMDGSEQVLNPAHMDSLTYEQVKDQPLHEKDLRRDTVAKGEPVYKITNDNKWYVACWMKEKIAVNYSEGESVQLQLPAGNVAATVRSVTPEEKRYKVIFASDMYYPDLTTAREMDMTILSNDHTGLLVDNECIIEKHGQQGVYVRDKNGDYYFVRVNVVVTDGKQSVISESKFYDPEVDDMVPTVSVYDEVLKQPKKELKKDLKEEAENPTEAPQPTKATQEATQAVTEQATQPTTQKISEEEQAAEGPKEDKEDQKAQDEAAKEETKKKDKDKKEKTKEETKKTSEKKSEKDSKTNKNNKKDDKKNKNNKTDETTED